jgi:hypothetical protein
MGSLTVFEISIIYSKIFHFIKLFWVLSKYFSMRGLSIRGNDFIVAAHTRKRFHHTVSLRRTNSRVCSASIPILTLFTLTSQSMLSQGRNDFITCWAYMWKRLHRLLSIGRNDFINIFSKLQVTLQDRLRALTASSQPIWARSYTSTSPLLRPSIHT